MANGLVRRGAIYHFRRRVPEDLIASYGKREVTFSLRTADPKAAKVLAAKEWVKLDEEFDHRRRAVATPAEPEDVADISPTVVALADLDLLRTRQARAARDGKLAAFNRECEEALVLLTAMLRGDIPAGDDIRVIEGKRNGLRALLTGEGAMGLAVKRRTLVPSSEAENRLRALTSTTWDRLVEQWAAERRPRAKTVQAHRSIAADFATVAGPLVETATRADVLRWKDHLVAQDISTANLGTKLSRLKTLANFAYDNDLVGSRIVQGIKLPKRKERARIPFDDQALGKLFSGPVHHDGARPAQGRGEAAYWLPLIALHTGARLEEIASLEVDDLVQLTLTQGNDRRRWFFRFRPDASENRTLKNVASERYTPVHPELERLGLIAYAESIRVARERQLFPRLTRHRSGKRAHKWGQWFSAYMRTTCGVTDGRLAFHSFRHTFKDLARESGVPEGLQRQLMGHEDGDVADGYGLGFSRHRMVAAMDSVRAPLPNLRSRQAE